MHDPDVHFKRITAATVLDVCKLSHTLSDAQREMVAGPGGVLPATWVRTHWGLLRVPARIRSKAGRVSFEGDKPFAAPNK